MTLVLAIRCTDGAVLASDGQATFDAVGQPTCRPVRKLSDLDGRIAWGAAGTVGLHQAVAERLLVDREEIAALRDPRAALVDAVLPSQQQAVRDFVPHGRAEPPDLACVFCWLDEEDGPRIFSVPRTGSDHQLHDDHVALGTGDVFADYAMASLAHLMPLPVAEAKLVALRVVQDAIAVAAAYLGPPIQMSTVTTTGARAVPPAELEGSLGEELAAWKERERRALGRPARLRPAA